MEFKFKENAEAQGSSGGFWYDLIDGGYIRPEEILEDNKQLQKVLEAIKILKGFENAMEARGFMKVRYRVEERLVYSGVIDLSEDAYNAWKDENDTDLGEFILDSIDRGNPSDWSIESVDEFEIVKE